MKQLISFCTALAILFTCAGCANDATQTTAIDPVSDAITTTTESDATSSATESQPTNESTTLGTHSTKKPSSSSSGIVSTTPSKTKQPTSTSKTTVADIDSSQPEKVTNVYSFDHTFPEVKITADIYKDPKNGNSLPYRLYFPKNYTPSRKYPVLLALHGAGEMGTDNKLQLHHMKNLFDCNGDLLTQGFVLCPQTNEWWGVDRNKTGDQKGMLGSVLHLLDEIKKTYSCDNNRIYVTGLSMGGYATWELLQDYGHLFAAGIPVCGKGDPAKASQLKNIPIKIYHSADDKTIPFWTSQEMYDAITAAGGKKVEFIQLDGMDHASWDYAYSDREGISWLYAQNKANNASGGYTYTPYFKVCDAKGNAIITEEDIDNLYCSIFYEGDKEQYSLRMMLTDAGRKKLDKAYAAKSTYTAYWLGQKMVTYTVRGLTQDNVFCIEKGLTQDSGFTIQDILTVQCAMRRYFVKRNTCFKRK